MKFVFFGTPQLSADILEHLKQHNLVPALIVTNPDRPQERKMQLAPPPVKVWAEANNIPLLQPEGFEDSVKGQLSKVKSDLFVVVAYGGILPKSLLDIPKHGSLNLHYSLLPKYRGASPIESAILNDDKDTGVSILLLDDKMDHGPTIAQRAIEFPISNFQFPNKSQNSNPESSKIDWPPKASELRDACNKLGAELLTETIPLWVEGKIEAKEQDHSKATYTKKFTKADGEINLADDLHLDEAERRRRAYKNFLKIQAFEGSIGTYFYYTEQKLNKNAERDGTVPSRFRVGGVPLRFRVLIKSAEYKDGTLNILRVIPEGKKEMSYEEFLRGLH